MISTTTSSTTTLAYPLYDGHGNMVATLGKNGSGGYTSASWRTFDVWGSVRSGSATGDPTKRYSANLGHQADDESDLLYMRARYYEPSSGRFASEDPGLDGSNWYTYCANNGRNCLNETGKFRIQSIAWYAGGQLWGYVFGLSAIVFASLEGIDPVRKLNVVAGMLALAVAGFQAALSFGTDVATITKIAFTILATGSTMLRLIVTIAGALDLDAQRTLAAAVIVTTLNILAIMGALLAVESGT